jgi:hypothetical protein
MALKCVGGKHFMRTADPESKACVDCHTPLCTHMHRSARGCMRTKGHEGLHCNYTSPFEGWNDEDGDHIGCHADWLAHLDRAGSRPIPAFRRFMPSEG